MLPFHVHLSAGHGLLLDVRSRISSLRTESDDLCVEIVVAVSI